MKVDDLVIIDCKKSNNNGKVGFIHSVANQKYFVCGDGLAFSGYYYEDQLILHKSGYEVYDRREPYGYFIEHRFPNEKEKSKSAWMLLDDVVIKKRIISDYCPVAFNLKGKNADGCKGKTSVDVSICKQCWLFPFEHREVE